MNQTKLQTGPYTVQSQFRGQTGIGPIEIYVGSFVTTEYKFEHADTQTKKKVKVTTNKIQVFLVWEWDGPGKREEIRPKLKHKK